ncbi:MAG: hypothetical protein U0234_14045 [Sandaracinus sp.]
MRIELRHRALAALALGVLGASCQPSVGHLSWEIAFADSALATRAARVEGRILTGGCTSAEVRYVAEAGRGQTPPMPPRLEAGRYGLAARAWDASCVEIATGCVDVDVPAANGSTIVVTLAASTERPVCPAAMCANGVCSVDAGGVGDAGSTSDANVPDAGPIDGGGSDAGRDAATVDAAGCTADAQCGECSRCMTGVCMPLTEGTSCRVTAGTCHAGACCGGCWDGASCQTGRADAACGASGASCSACSGAAPICETSGSCGVGRTIQSYGVGTAFVCAIATDGALFCWGDDVSGQLGQGTSDVDRDVPTRVGASTSWSILGLGDGHVCASRAAELYCWGDDMDGQIGFADMVTRSTPTLVASATGPWARIDGARAGDSTCTVTAAGVVACMGQNDFGQLGLGDLTARSMLVPLTGTWRAYSQGHHFACGIQSDGSLWCTGQNDVGELGRGTSGIGTNTSSPLRIGTDTTWTAVSAGDTHACAIRAGELYCWGQGAEGRLGNGGVAVTTAPARVGTDADWTSVAAGTTHTCGIRAGTLWCWGRNTEGQLGLGAAGAQHTTPAQVGTASDWQSVAMGNAFGCGMRTGAQLYCWGTNLSGQLGQNDVAMRPSPTRVYLPAQ